MIPRTNHVLHVILSVLTGGLWLPVYAIAAHRTAKRRRWFDEGRLGERVEQAGRRQPADPTPTPPPAPSLEPRS